MKKIFTLLAAALFAVGTFAASYGIMVNGTDFHAGEANPTPADPSFQEYMVLGLSVSNGSTLQLWDQDNSAGWAVDLDPASTAGISRDGDHYTCSADGCYDFYIKLKYGEDQLYIGACSGGGGGGQGGGGGEGGDPSGYEFYAIGWINGADHGETAYATYEDEFKFVDGKLTIDCKMGSYIAIKDDDGNFYYAEGSQEPKGSKVTLKWANGWSPCQKWSIPEGTQYIIMRSLEFKGNIDLELVDKATYDAYHLDLQAIENTTVSEKAHKVIIDGELRIIRGDKVFDATGRQL